MGDSSSRRRRRIWRFGDVEFDEASWMLRVDGRAAALESKPLEVLHELLLRAGEVVTKDEILDAVWPGIIVVEGSLATAVSKLRKAMGDSGGQAIETVPRVGYRFSAPVTLDSVEQPLTPRFSFAPGDHVPGRTQWVLQQSLSDSGANDVWLGRHEKTEEQRVFKFADAPDRLRALKREATLVRLIMRGLGPQAPVPPLIEYDFGSAPYRLECAYGGDDLVQWARSSEGLLAIPPEVRLGVAIKLCRAVAAIHGIGILHKDLKPANVLIALEHGEPIVRLADFGSGRLLEDRLLDAFAITDPGSLDVDDALGDDRSGTATYRAPELVGHNLPTAKSDIYALGLIVFQLMVGDFRRSLDPGWESLVDDPLLRSDIAAAAAGDPRDRLASAAGLAERLESLEHRRNLAAQEEEASRQLAHLRAVEAQRAVRRPWMRAAMAAIVLGLAGTSAAAIWALQQRDLALDQQAIAQASFAFLAEDVLAKADPAEADGADETMADALKRASSEIDKRFETNPLIAARLHQSIARAMAERAEYRAARREFAAADAFFAKAGDRDGRIMVAYQSAMTQARSVEEDSLEEANASLAEAKARWGGPDQHTGEAAMWAYAAEGTLAMVDSRSEDALRAFGKSASSASQIERKLTAREQIALQQRIIAAQLRLDRMEEAERAARALIVQASLLLGQDHPDTLLVRLNLAQALLGQQKNGAMIAEATSLLPLVERRFGPDHPRTLQLLGSRMDALKNLERYKEARLDGERLWRSAEQRFGAKSFYSVGSRLDTARVRCRAGDTAGGIEDAMASYDWAVEGFGRDHALTHGVSHGVADCLIAAGRYAQARPYLEDLDRRAVGELVGNKDWGLHVDLLLAQIAANTKQFGEARRYLEASRPAFADLKTDAYELRRISAIERTLQRVNPR